MEAKQRKPSLLNRSRHAQARQCRLGLKHTCLKLGPKRRISHNPTEQEAKGVLVGQQQQEQGMPALDDEVGETYKCKEPNLVFPNAVPGTYAYEPFSPPFLVSPQQAMHAPGCFCLRLNTKQMRTASSTPLHRCAP